MKKKPKLIRHGYGVWDYQKAWLKKKAKESGWTANEYLRMLLDEEIKERK